MTKLAPLFALIGLWACTADSTEMPPTKPEPTSTSSTTTGTTTTTATTGTTSTDTGPLPQFDCATVPDTAGPAVPLDAPRGYNDIVFDSAGTLIGSDENVFWAATAPDTATIYAAGIGQVYKMGVLPGGDIVAARSAGDGGGVIRVDSSGGTIVLAPGLNGYGLAVGSDGNIYLATNYTSGAEAIIRIDPATGDGEMIVDTGPYPARAIAFNRDFSRLYFGTMNGGRVYGVDLDVNLDPVGDPGLIATVPDGWHDTVEVDACGQIYVGSVFSSSIFRINQDLSIIEILDWTFNTYGHGLEWGSAAGGWDEFSVYVTHPYVGSRVDAYELGVPGAHWVGDVIGGVTL
ncbi:MAG: hypothetical protein GWP91_10205 [Rhodobacterales bacterium]|nr:hypothetical protein [Rhodobacterales bacterium]